MQSRETKNFTVNRVFAKHTSWTKQVQSKCLLLASNLCIADNLLAVFAEGTCKLP